MTKLLIGLLIIFGYLITGFILYLLTNLLTKLIVKKYNNDVTTFIFLWPIIVIVIISLIPYFLFTIIKDFIVKIFKINK